MTGTDELTIDIEQELHIDAPIAEAFEAMIYHFTEGNMGSGDNALSLELEAKPGGRWFRNLGDGHGHLWGFVQSLREPELIELSGPMFMSYPVNNHIIVRFEEADGGTHLHFRHRAFGLIEAEHRDGVTEGWVRILDNVKSRAEDKTRS